jgi:hypothetical protein
LAITNNVEVVMVMKRVALAALSMFALALAFHLGALSSSAGGPGIVGIGGYFVIMQDGRLWTYVPGAGWGLRAGGELPFPASELALFDGSFAVDGSGSLLELQFAGGQYHWAFVGQPPGSTGIGDAPHPTPSTWGRVKAQGGR